MVRRPASGVRRRPFTLSNYGSISLKSAGLEVISLSTVSDSKTSVIDGWLRMGLLPPLGNFADISYLVEN